MLNDKTVDVGGVPFVVTDLETAAHNLVSAGQQGLAFPVRLWNAYCVGLTASDPAYREMARTGVILPDGTPVAWWMRLRTLTMRGVRPQRTRGPSLFVRTIETGVGAGLRHALFGGTPDTMAELLAALRLRFPGIHVSVGYAPPFGPVTPELVADLAERARASEAQIVWLGLGTPKQDYLAAELAEAAQMPVVGVGAAFDFVAGTVSEAPIGVQRLGLEWAYRLTREPKRLWRRYTIGSAWFAAALIGVRRRAA